MAVVFSMAKLHVRACSSSSSSSSWSNATEGDGKRVDGRAKTPLRRTYYAERCALAVQGALGEDEATHLVQCAAMQDVSERMRRMESGTGNMDEQESSDGDWEGFACTWRIQGRSPRSADAALSCATTVQVDATRAVQYRKEAWKKCRNMGKEDLHQIRAKLAYESSLVTLLQADEFECEFMSAQGDTRAIKGNEKLLEELVRTVAKHMAQGKTDKGEQVRVLASRGGSKELAWRKHTDYWESVLLEEETWDDFIECLDMMLADSKTLPRLYVRPPAIQAPKRRFLRPWMQVGSILVLLGFAGYRMLLPWLPSLPRGIPGESKLYTKAVAAGWPTRTVDLASLRGDIGEPLRVANGELTAEEMNSLCKEVQSHLQEKVNKPLKVNEFSTSKVMLFQVVLDEKHKVVGYAPASAAALSAWEELPFLQELGKSWSIAQARYGAKPKKAYVVKLAIKEDGSFHVTEWERDDGVVVDWSAQ